MTEFYSVLMAMNAVCAISILLSGIDKQRPYFVALAVLNVILFFFHLLSLSLHSATDVKEAIYISKLHLICVIIGHPFLMLVLGLWTRFKHVNTLFIAFCFLSLPLLIINITSDFSIRYGENVELINYQTVFGDTASILRGEGGAYFPLLHLSYGLSSLFMMYCVFQFFKQRQTYLFAALLITVLLQLGASVVGYHIDQQSLNWVYVGGVPSTVLSLLVLGMVSRGFKEKSNELDKEFEQKSALQNVFAELAQISNEDGQHAFYEESIELLTRYAKADYVAFGLVDSNDAQHITTKVVFKDGERIDNFTYERRGTPCENVLSIESCIHRANVADDYPDDAFLREEGIEAYIGYPIVGSKQCTIGVLVLLYRTPLQNDTTIKTVTDVFATRISAELRRQALQDELKATAYVDYLTRLPNRIKLLRYINSIRSQFLLDRNQALLMMFDLDHFGEVNRKYGYDVGDRVLKVVGDRLQSYANEGVFISRCGGDEFAVVIPDVKADIASVSNVHWTAIQAIVNKTCEIGNRRININCTMGAVVFPSQLDSGFDVIGAAEQAMMVSKEQGRGRFSFFDPALLVNVEHARELEADLISAIHNEDGLDVFYQPKVSRDGAIVGAEALVRWFSKKRGFVSPAEFIPVAEETGVIHMLGKWVVERVINDIAQWQNNGLHVVPIAINATASQFEDNEFIQHLMDSIEHRDVSPRLIELELTESGLLTEREKAIATLNALRAFGITVALDDFGTGYSSLSYLSELPLDVLKIDKSFVDGLHDERNRELVKSIIAISKAMDLKNVAEGTETLEQVELMASYGCTLFQGYYFSKPLAKTEFESWLSKRR